MSWLAALRWLLVIPAGWAGWIVAALATMAADGLVPRLCPADEVVSGVCVAPWAPYAEKAIIAGGAGLAGALVVLFAALMAPAHRGAVAVLAFGAGLVAALYMAVMADAYAELAAAVGAGLLVVWWVRRRRGARSPRRAPAG
jgi:hypothetical protein